MPYTDKNVNDFLRIFLTSIKSELPGNSFRFSDFEAAYNKSLISTYKPEQHLENENEDLSWIDDFKDTIFYICKVVNDPRATITSYKEAVRVEKIVRIDSNDVMYSSQQTPFWYRDGNGNIVPKMFSTSINERDICIYENKFVVYTIDLMLDYVEQTIFRIRKKIRNLSQQFSKESFSLTDVEIITDLAEFKTFKQVDSKRKPKITRVPLLTSNKSDVAKNLEALEMLRKDLLRITFTPFYNTIKKSRGIANGLVYPTNLLLGERSYSKIYDFYLRFLLLRVAPRYKAPIYRPWYNDYVALTLLMTLKELGFTFNQNRIMFTDVHHLILRNYKCEKDGIKVHIDMHDNMIDLTFTVMYIEGKFHKINNLAKKRENRICLLMVPNPKSKDEVEVRKLYSSLISKKVEDEGYTNAFIVSPHDEFNIPNAVIVTPFTSNVDLSLKNVIQSSLIFVEGDSKMYSKICPVCGRRTDGEWDDGNCHCYECNSVWTTFISGDNHKYQNTVWIKAIKRSG